MAIRFIFNDLTGGDRYYFYESYSNGYDLPKSKPKRDPGPPFDADPLWTPRKGDRKATFAQVQSRIREQNVVDTFLAEEQQRAAATTHAISRLQRGTHIPF